MGLSCCDTMFKIILFIFNFVFFLAGIAVIAVGSVVIAQESDYDTLIGTDFYGIAILLIVIGCIITIVCFFGCFGAMKENKCMLYTYSALLCVIFCAELGGGIAAFVYRGDISSNTVNNMLDSMKSYDCDTTDDVTDGADDNIKTQWDNIQQDSADVGYSGCCGTNGPSDWTNSTSPALCQTNAVPVYGGTRLPDSCCKPDKSPCDYDTSNPQKSDSYYTGGCAAALQSTIDDQSVLIAGIAVGLAVVEIIGIAIACCLARDVKD